MAGPALRQQGKIEADIPGWLAKVGQVLAFLTGIDEDNPEQSSVEMLMGGPLSAGMSVARAPGAKKLLKSLSDLKYLVDDGVNLAEHEAPEQAGSLLGWLQRSGATSNPGAKVVSEDAAHGAAGFFKRPPTRDIPGVVDFSPRDLARWGEDDARTFIGLNEKTVRDALADASPSGEQFLRNVLSHEGIHAATLGAPPDVQREVMRAFSDPDTYIEGLKRLAVVQPSTAMQLGRRAPINFGAGAGGKLAEMDRRSLVAELLAEAFSGTGEDLIGGGLLNAKTLGNVFDTFGPFADELRSTLNVQGRGRAPSGQLAADTLDILRQALDRMPR